MIWLVALCGGLGALARWGVDAALRRWWHWLPATVVINTLGSAALGWLVGASASQVVPSATVALVGVGFCGGFTTLSTAAVEVVKLVRAGRVWSALGLLLGGLLLGWTAALAGHALA